MMERKYEGDVSAACEDALEITSSKPSGKELALKRYIVSRASDCEDAELVVEALCHLGILWRDLSIYTEALNICRDEMVDFVLPRENDIIAAVNCFGSEEVQERCVAPTLFTSHFFDYETCRLDTYLVDPTREALRLLGCLQDQLAAHSDESVSQTIIPWFRHHALNITAGFDAKEGSQGDAKLLVSLVASYRDLAFLKDKCVLSIFSSNRELQLEY